MLPFLRDENADRLWIMKIRPHTSSDYHAIAELRWHLKKDDVRGLNDRRKREYVDQYVRHLVETDQEGRTVHWLIEEDGAVVGVMTVRIVQKRALAGQRKWQLGLPDELLRRAGEAEPWPGYTAA